MHGILSNKPSGKTAYPTEGRGTEKRIRKGCSGKEWPGWRHQRVVISQVKAESAEEEMEKSGRSLLCHHQGAGTAIQPRQC